MYTLSASQLAHRIRVSGQKSNVLIACKLQYRLIRWCRFRISRSQSLFRTLFGRTRHPNPITQLRQGDHCSVLLWPASSCAQSGAVNEFNAWQSVHVACRLSASSEPPLIPASARQSSTLLLNVHICTPEGRPQNESLSHVKA